MDDLSSIGGRLRYARQTRALTQAELAARIERDHKHISQIERGHFRQPRPVTLRRVAVALDISVGWLATGHGCMERGES